MTENVILLLFAPSVFPHGPPKITKLTPFTKQGVSTIHILQCGCVEDATYGPSSKCRHAPLEILEKTRSHCRKRTLVISIYFLESEQPSYIRHVSFFFPPSSFTKTRKRRAKPSQTSIPKKFVKIEAFLLIWGRNQHRSEN
jgi:hypothetical protein